MCTRPTRAFNANGEVVQLACDLWACPECSKVLAYRWADRVRYGIALRPDADPWFWTLTLPAWVQTRGVGYKVLPSRWDALRRELQRTYTGFSYCAFVEGHPHRAHIPHFHIITFAAPTARIKDLAVRAGFGHQAKALQINGKIAVSYVTKYASKQGTGMPRHFRRVRVSHDWPALPPPLYEVKVYPIERREALSVYLARMSTVLREPVSVLRDIWLDKSRDIR